jgi:hypothetical protein
MRKIEAMHHYYGHGVGFCKDCPHFSEKIYSRTYFKCLVYGDSASEATDWRKSYVACGLIDKPFPDDERRVVERIVARKQEDQPLPGQMTIDDILGTV